VVQVGVAGQLVGQERSRSGTVRTEEENPERRGSHLDHSGNLEIRASRARAWPLVDRSGLQDIGKPATGLGPSPARVVACSTARGRISLMPNWCSVARRERIRPRQQNGSGSPIVWGAASIQADPMQLVNRDACRRCSCRG